MPIPTDRALDILDSFPERAKVVVYAIAAAYDIDPALFVDKCRASRVSEVRQVTFCLLLESGFTAAEVARFTMRDHSTVIHNNAQALLRFPNELTALREILGGSALPDSLNVDQARGLLESWLRRSVQPVDQASVRSYVLDGLFDGHMGTGARPMMGLMVVAKDAVIRSSFIEVLDRCRLSFVKARFLAHAESCGY